MRPMRIGVVSDTHLPRFGRVLPRALVEGLTTPPVDLILHLGDFTGLEVPALFEALAPFDGVAGNNDGPDLHARMPEVARAELAGVRVAVLHDSGPAAGRDARMAARFPDVDLLVFGHSHIPWDGRSGRLRLLNPGSPTDRRRQPACTFMTAEVRDGEVADVVLHRLPPRASP